MAEVNVRLEETHERRLSHRVSHLVVHFIEDVRPWLQLVPSQQLDGAAHLLRDRNLGPLEELVDRIDHLFDLLGLAHIRQAVACEKELEPVLVDAALLLDEPLEQSDTIAVAQQA